MPKSKKLPPAGFRLPEDVATAPLDALDLHSRLSFSRELEVWPWMALRALVAEEGRGELLVFVKYEGRWFRGYVDEVTDSHLVLSHVDDPEDSTKFEISRINSVHIP